MFVHHTASASSYSAADVPSLIRGFYRFHVLSRGWFDIGYNYLVDRYGRIYEGRSGGITNNVRGAQVAGFNTGSAGVALIGNYGSAAPTEAQSTALRDIVAWRLDLAHVDPLSTQRLISAGGDRYAAGRGGAGEGHLRPSRRRLHRAAPAPSCTPGSRPCAPRSRRCRCCASTTPWSAPPTSTRMPACCRSGSPPACRPRRRGASPSPTPPARPVAEWTGTGTAVDATWTEPVPTSLTGLRWSIEAGAARPAVGAFNDVSAAPYDDVLRSPRIAGTATGTVTVAYSLTAAARISAAITDPAGEVVKVLDAGTRRAARRAAADVEGPERPLPRRAAHGSRRGRRHRHAAVRHPPRRRVGDAHARGRQRPRPDASRAAGRGASRPRRFASGLAGSTRTIAAGPARQDRRQLRHRRRCPRDAWSFASRSSPPAARRSSRAACSSTAPRPVRRGSATAAASCAARCRSAPPSPSAAPAARSPRAASPSASAS